MCEDFYFPVIQECTSNSVAKKKKFVGKMNENQTKRKRVRKMLNREFCVKTREEFLDVMLSNIYWCKIG